MGYWMPTGMSYKGGQQDETSADRAVRYRPIMDGIVGVHRSRLYDNTFMSQSDWNVLDWDISAVGGPPTATLVSNASSNQGPALRVTGTNVADGYTARHAAKHLQMPSTTGSSPHHFYVAFEFCCGTTNTFTNRSFGIATDVALNIWNPNTGAMFTAGGGIAWQNVGASPANETWSLVYKSLTGSLVTLGTLTNPGIVSGANWFRAGFMVYQNPAGSSPTQIGFIQGFMHRLASNLQGGEANADVTNISGDDSDGGPITEYTPAFALTSAEHGSTSGTQAGLFFGHGQAAGGGSVRDTFLRRIVCIDNLRR